MIIFSFSEFFTSLITLIQSFWFSFERLLNFFNQNFGFSNICLQDWLTCAQIFKSSTSKFQKIFSARCWRPGLLMIFSILNDNCRSSLYYLLGTWKEIHKNRMISAFVICNLRTIDEISLTTGSSLRLAKMLRVEKRKQQAKMHQKIIDNY